MRTVYHEGTYPIINKDGLCVHIEATLDAAMEWVEDNWVDEETIEMKIIDGVSRSTIVSFHEDEPAPSTLSGYFAGEMLKYMIKNFDRGI